MAEPILELSGITKDYGKSVITRVLHGIDLRISRAELTALIGPSGSGKSTLLNIMGLLDRPTSGELRVQGRSVRGLADDELAMLRGKALGFVFQFHHLISAFTALENVTMPSFIEKGRVEPSAIERAADLLERVGMKSYLKRRVTDLSGGQQQRVAIARALSMAPALVLADEPTGNLDTETADEIFAMFRRFNAEDKTSFLVVTHDPRLADRCDRIIRLVDGRVASDQTGPSVGPCRACGYGPCLHEGDPEGGAASNL